MNMVTFKTALDMHRAGYLFSGTNGKQGADKRYHMTAPAPQPARKTAHQRRMERIL